MPKPQTISGYEDMVTDACERVLVKLAAVIGELGNLELLLVDLLPNGHDLRLLLELDVDPVGQFLELLFFAASRLAEPGCLEVAKVRKIDGALALGRAVRVKDHALDFRQQAIGHSLR